MACMVAYKLSPDTRQILDILGDLFEEAMRSLKARGEVLGADDPGPGAEIRRPQEVKAELGRLQEMQQREAMAIDEYVRYGPHTTGPPRQQPPRDASSDEDGFQEAHDEQPPVPHGRQPIPASRDMFTESERRSMSRTSAEMFQNRHLVLYMKRLNDLRLPKKESFDHLRKGKNRQTTLLANPIS